MSGGGWCMEKRCCKVQLSSLGSASAPSCLLRSQIHASFDQWVWQNLFPYHLGATVHSTSRSAHRPHTGISLLHLAASSQTKMWFVLSPWGFVLACCSPAISGNDYFPWLLLWDCRCTAAISASAQTRDAALRGEQGETLLCNGHAAPSGMSGKSLRNQL